MATALREVRVALLEADVSLPVARDFVKAVQDKATGQSVTRSVTPGQQVVKIVHDELIDVLAGEGEPGALKIDNAAGADPDGRPAGRRQDHHHRQARQAADRA